MSEMVINKLPGRTFEWLGANETLLNGVEEYEGLRYKTEIPEGVHCRTEGKSSIYEIPAGSLVAAPVYLWLAYDRSARNTVNIHVGKGSEITVVMDYSAPDAGRVLDAVLDVRIQAGERAKVKLIQLQKAQEGARFINVLHADCEAEADLQVTQLFLGDGRFYQDLRCDLNGYRSSFGADAAYMIDRAGILDLNYNVVHFGPKTASDIQLNGVLRDQADKIFRGTIDFKRGAVGAAGNEKEDVLLMDPTVSNKTIPLILCQEENVSGTHGATIGRLGKELLFYLESRGMTKDQVYEMMARARIDALVGRIKDERTRRVIREDMGDAE